MSKAQFSFDSSYNNFVSELNMKFTEELNVINQHCRDYENLSEIFRITQDRQRKEVVFKSMSNVQVGATQEVKKAAQFLKRKYGLKLRFE